MVGGATKDEMGDAGREEVNGKMIEDFDELLMGECYSNFMFVFGYLVIFVTIIFRKVKREGEGEGEGEGVENKERRGEWNESAKKVPVGRTTENDGLHMNKYSIQIVVANLCVGDIYFLQYQRLQRRLEE